jgi:hypothetical protein
VRHRVIHLIVDRREKQLGNWSARTAIRSTSNVCGSS